MKSMTLASKILSGIVLVLLGGLLVLLIPTKAPSPTFAGGSLYAPHYAYATDTTQNTSTLFAFPGILHTIAITKPITNSVITVYDSNTSTAPTQVVTTITISPTSSPFSMILDAALANGLTVVQSGGTSSMTFTFQQN